MKGDASIECATELFQIKGRLAEKQATPADFDYIRSSLSSSDEFVRLFAASVAITQEVHEFDGPAYTIVNGAISSQHIGGAFVQMIFWEALCRGDLRKVVIEVLLDLAAKTIDVPGCDLMNITFLLRRIIPGGFPRATAILEKLSQ
jgi:hypothetical protein